MCILMLLVYNTFVNINKTPTHITAGSQSSLFIVNINTGGKLKGTRKSSLKVGDILQPIIVGGSKINPVMV